jgi:dTDP-4-amino-4,6-dideoxygalactose transaminase
MLVSTAPMRRRQTFLPYSLPDFDGTELAFIAQAINSGWVTTGPLVKRFEREFAERVGAAHAVAVNSCTAALHLALEAIGLGPGDEVITSPYTFAATAEVVRYFGARPRFVDVEPDTLNLDPAAVAASITPRTRALLPVHVGGHPAEIATLDDLAADHGLAMIEDAAHALPASYRGGTIGAARPRLDGVPHVVCYSFYATKTLTTGEGGMICTADAALAERCRLMSLHGISKDAWKRYSQEGSWYYEIVAPGYKYNMTDIAAGMGLGQLAKLDGMTRRRQSIARRYTEAFMLLDAFDTPSVRADVEHAWHLYMLRLVPGRLSIDRARFVEELRERNIGTSVHFIPLHVHPYYRETYCYVPEDFPVAYTEYLREVSLPLFSAMSDDDAEDVIAAVSDVARRFAV